MAGLVKGTLLYHGTKAPEDFDYPDGPAWFSTARSVAEEFVSWHSWGDDAEEKSRVLVYRVVKRIPRLVLIDSREDMDDLVRRLDDGMGDLEFAGPTDLAEATCDAGWTGWHIPWNYPDGSDTMICEPTEWLELIGRESV